MTTELFYLVLLAAFASAMWIPYIVGVNMHPGDDKNANFLRPRDLALVPAWVHRAHRAHLNLMEQLVPMAVLVLIANQLGISNGITVGAVVAFFWLRIVHAVGMVSGVARFPVRPILFTSGWVCILIMAWQVLAV